MNHDIKDMRDRLSRCRQCSGLRRILDAHIAMFQHPLYADRVKLNAEDLRGLASAVDQVVGLATAWSETKKSSEEAQVAQSSAPGGIGRCMDVFFRPFTRRERQAALDTAIVNAEGLQARLGELLSQLRELERSTVRRFFPGIPLAIQAPDQPNVFGVDDAGFEEGCREFRLFGHRAKYMVVVKLNDYLSLLDPTDVLAILEEELDAYGQHLLQYMQSRKDHPSVQAHIAYRSLYEQWVESEETPTISYGRSPALYDKVLQISRDYSAIVRANCDLFHTHMNRFVRRLLPLPEGFGDDILIYLDDRVPAGCRQKGLFALLEDYFAQKNIIFDIGIEDELGVGQYVSVRIGRVVQQSHRKDVFLGLPIDYDFIEAQISGGCAFIARSYYDCARNQIFLDDLTAPGREGFTGLLSTFYSAAQIRNDVLNHERAHAVFEKAMATCTHTSSLHGHVLSEVFARLVDGCFGTCLSQHIRSMAQMKYGSASYAGAFRELDRLVGLSALVQELPTDAHCSGNQMEADIENLHVRRAFREALLRFCDMLVTDHRADPEIIGVVRRYIMETAWPTHHAEAA